ncbi:hypothetical protein [Xenorhabdus cabanillasii]|uniref:hypothetical protein n=2 Tax=Xenorhabdus cabanillasii TaxID=351673 RepID=UPI000C03FAD1|nr:hypothetical protein [Xenorhabdus cabanillasii]PHM72162.1 hypothetical protein Xcab_04360 [Xenorhabdus cabanillasii JM26]
MITGVADVIAYTAYMSSEDILEKMCVSATNCSKLKTLFYGLMKEKKTDNDIKILREMLVDMGLNADSFMQDLEQAHERFQAFIKGVLEILCHSSKLSQKGMTNDSTLRF